MRFSPIIIGGHISQGLHLEDRALDFGFINSSQKSYIGTPYLLAWTDGKVAQSHWSNRGGGNVVVTEHPSNDPNFKYLIRLAHNERNLAQKGDIVKAGQRIAIAGATGIVTGPHVHAEVWIVPTDYQYVDITTADRNAYAVNPELFLPMNNIDQRGRIKQPHEYHEVNFVQPMVAKTSATALRMRDYPSPLSKHIGAMPPELKALGYVNNINGHDWAICEFEGKTVFVAKDWVALEPIACEPTIIEVPVFEPIEYVEHVGDYVKTTRYEKKTSPSK